MPSEKCGVVVDTAGCPTDLSVEEQMAWAVMSKHPMLLESWSTPQHLRDAVAFEANADFEELDKEREALLAKVAAHSSKFTATSLCIAEGK